MRILFSFLLSALIATIANASFQDDFDIHATFVGQTRINHTAKVHSDIVDGGRVYYDSTRPAARQLIVRPKGRLVRYTCPAVPGVLGLEEPRKFRLCEEWVTDKNDTKIELLSAAYDEHAVCPLAGFYRTLSIVLVGSVVENGSRVNTLRMACRSGVADGMPLTFLYKETEYIPAASLSLNVLGSHDLNLVGSNIQSCTISFWYQPAASLARDTDFSLFKLSWPANEKGLEGKTKETACLVKQISSDNSLSVKFHYPMLSAGERSVMGPEYRQVDEKVRKTKAVRAPWASLSKEQAITYLRTLKLPKGYSAAYSGNFQNFFNMTRVVLAKQLTQGRWMTWEVMRGLWDGCCQHGLWKAQPYMAKTGKKIKVATGRNIEVSREPISVMRNETCAAGSLPEESSFHIVFSFNASARRIKAYGNGVKLWTAPLGEQFGVQTLQALGQLIFGDHAAKISEGVFMEGEHGPKTFGCFNSLDFWVPKKLETPLGAKGFVLAAATPRPKPQGPTAANAAQPTKVAAKGPTKVAKGPAKVAKGPAKAAKGPAKVAKGPAKGPAKLVKASAKMGPGKK